MTFFGSCSCKELHIPKEEEGKEHIWECRLSHGTKMGYQHLMTAATAAEQTWAPGMIMEVQTGTREVRLVLQSCEACFTPAFQRRG